MRTARWAASECISAYQAKTAGDDGVRGEGAWPLAPMHPVRSPHRTRRAHALQILPRPGASAQRIEPRSPSPHRTPAKTPRLPVPGRHVQRSRIETSPRVEIRRTAVEGVATGAALYALLVNFGSETISRLVVTHSSERALALMPF